MQRGAPDHVDIGEPADSNPGSPILCLSDWRLKKMRNARRLVVLASLFLGTFCFPRDARAAELAVATVAGTAGTRCGAAHVRLERLGDGGVRPEERRRDAKVTVPGEAVIDLPAATWRATLRGEGCWGNSLVVHLGAANRKIRLSAWPRAEVIGRLIVPRGSKLPRDLLLTFAPAHRLRQGGDPQGKARCQVEHDGTFRCHSPAARLDLRLSTTGYAAAYAWNVDLGANPGKPLGDLRLVPGASLAGWIATSDGRPLPKAVRVRAAPRGLSHAVTPQEGRLLNLTTAQGSAREDGFFQVTGLEGGDYEVTVTAPGFAESKALGTVTAARESQLRDPVILSPPLSLAVVLDPPTAPNGQPWRILLGATDRFRSHLRPIAEAAVPASGWFERGGLNAGHYLVKVLSPNGAGWAAREVELGVEPMPITLELGAVQVQGTVKLGDDPLAQATVWFGGRFGAEKVELRTDRGGRYETVLPRAGTWQVDVSAREPVVTRRFSALDVPTPKGGKPAIVDIHLADTTLTGEVRMRDGSTIDWAAVRVWPLGEGLWAGNVSHRVEGSNRFSIRGLAEGSYFVNADRAGARAPSQVVTLSEGGRQHVELVLDRYTKIAGRVVSEGHPVSGALVILQPTQDWAFLPRQIQTDAQGSFDYELPQHTTEVIAHVAAPGRTYAAFRARTSDAGLSFDLPGQGGVLSLDLPPGLNDIGADSVLVVFRDSAPLETGTLHTWSRINPGEGADGGAGVLVARSLAPGYYEACSVPKSRFVAWMQGTRDPVRCASGDLSALGSLTLRVPRKGGEDSSESRGSRR